MKIFIIVFTLLIPLTFLAKAEELFYPNGAKKAVIFSYDDGVTQDRKLVDIFNKYHVVGTFNLNSGLFGKKLAWMKDFTGKAGEYILIDEVKSLYQGHEVAGHSYSHPGLAGLNDKELTRQIELDQQSLMSITGSIVKSFAYPLGTYDVAAMKALHKANFTNARTVEDTHKFELPENYLVWHPTVHHSRAMPLVDEYVKLNSKKLTVMLIWGHSWEFDMNEQDNNWQYAEELVKKIANNSDIWYVSAGEFTDFIQSKSSQLK
mgnify:CR=1 FL=1